MTKFPHVVGPKRLKAVLEKIQEVGIPKVADKSWLQTMGFKSPQDGPILEVLKFLGFTDKTNKPNDLWRIDYLDKPKAKRVMASAMRKAYSELFHFYKDACGRKDEDLKNFFRQKTPGADVNILKRMVLTFKALCELADFKSPPVDVSLGEPEPTPTGKAPETKDEPVYRGLAEGVTININTQLTLPETKDPEVYKSFFQALKNNLLDTKSKKKNE